MSTDALKDSHSHAKRGVGQLSVLDAYAQLEVRLHCMIAYQSKCHSRNLHSAAIQTTIKQQVSADMSAQAAHTPSTA